MFTGNVSCSLMMKNLSINFFYAVDSASTRMTTFKFQWKLMKKLLKALYAPYHLRFPPSGNAQLNRIYDYSPFMSSLNAAFSLELTHASDTCEVL